MAKKLPTIHTFVERDHDWAPSDWDLNVAEEHMYWVTESLSDRLRIRDNEIARLTKIIIDNGLIDLLETDDD